MSTYSVPKNRDIPTAQAAFLAELGIKAHADVRLAGPFVAVPDAVSLADADRIMAAAVPGSRRVAPAVN